jgi:protein-L-isoaspartate(D-aspartate) O-methyltransferase
MDTFVSAPELCAARRQMVETQIRARGIQEERVLAVMAAMPRELFVAPALAAAAYDDRALPAAEQQTISQPYIVALMTERLRMAPHHRVLEIGTGTGYQAAILSMLCAHVYTVERLANLSSAAAERLRRLALNNVSYRVGDGSLGWAEGAPYDRIIVTAGAPAIADVLVQQLTVGGRLIIPVGEEHSQMLYAVERRPEGVVEERLIPCRFVRLVGAAGWPDQE